jgi:sugar-specific transcriptional regulator TrmB
VLQKERDKLSLERVLKALMYLGLTQTDAEVFVCLASRGPQKAANIEDTLRMPRRQVYRCLRRLRIKGIVEANVERSVFFSALSLEKVIDFSARAMLDEANNVEKDKKKFLSIWHSMIAEDQES